MNNNRDMVFVWLAWKNVFPTVQSNFTFITKINNNNKIYKNAPMYEVVEQIEAFIMEQHKKLDTPVFFMRNLSGGLEYKYTHSPFEAIEFVKKTIT